MAVADGRFAEAIRRRELVHTDLGARDRGLRVWEAGGGLVRLPQRVPGASPCDHRVPAYASLPHEAIYALFDMCGKSLGGVALKPASETERQRWSAWTTAHRPGPSFVSRFRVVENPAGVDDSGIPSLVGLATRRARAEAEAAAEAGRLARAAAQAAAVRARLASDEHGKPGARRRYGSATTSANRSTRPGKTLSSSCSR